MFVTRGSVVIAYPLLGDSVPLFWAVSSQACPGGAIPPLGMPSLLSSHRECRPSFPEPPRGPSGAAGEGLDQSPIRTHPGAPHLPQSRGSSASSRDRRGLSGSFPVLQHLQHTLGIRDGEPSPVLPLPRQEQGREVESRSCHGLFQSSGQSLGLVLLWDCIFFPRLPGKTLMRQNKGVIFKGMCLFQLFRNSCSKLRKKRVLPSHRTPSILSHNISCPSHPIPASCVPMSCSPTGHRPGGPRTSLPSVSALLAIPGPPGHSRSSWPC